MLQLKKMRFYLFIQLILSVGLLSCREKSTTLFSRLSASNTGINFKNLLKEDDPTFSILGYPYFYNGGGVAIGDINNDGLPDVLFTGNMVPNALYLNKGHFKFDDITSLSTIGEMGGWNSGAVMADVNADGWLDIYICRSGLFTAKERGNLLFINNHDLTFTENAAKFGLDDPGYSTQASFFDYDKDGDLDMFLINQSDPQFSRGYQDYMQTRKQVADSALANKLYRNDKGYFINVSKEAGIKSTIFSFSLGISTSDINQDGWPDIYVANDFEEPDYLYINNKNGTFTDSLSQKIDHTSLFSMGVDVADYNNDLLVDVMTLDMLPEKNFDQKMHIGSDNFSRNTFMFQNGVPFQYMKNSLQKNNGDGTFSEIGQLAGVSNTDWSWSPLFADFDNDGLKDIFITNGYKHDNTNMEFMGYAMDQSLHIQKGGNAASVQQYISHMPGINIPNYIFKNKGNDHFENKVKDWGFDHNTFSHGAAYVDLDNDGDLDLVTNNTEDEAGIYRNNSETLLKNNFIKIRIQGPPENIMGIGSKVFVYAGEDKFYFEQNPVRGYQSSVDFELLAGLGKHVQIDSLRIIWPGGESQLVKNVVVNKTLTISISDSGKYTPLATASNPLLREVKSIDFVHIENNVNDFARQFLLPHFLSYTGPCMTKGDVNGDGLNDIYVGGAKGQPGAIFLQQRDLTFTLLVTPAFESDKESEDTDAVFFDSDGDHDLDLYVVSGGYEFDANSTHLQDRIYLNNGTGGFSKSAGALPINLSNKTCVRPVDFDNDGDMDLFIGGGIISGNYPLAAVSKIFFNDGIGNFAAIKPASAALGLVNGAVWVDLNGDGKKDLITVGEWSPLKAFLTEGSLFREVSSQWFPFPSFGWWHCIAAEDIDSDGDIDLVVGNYGLNSQIRADEHHPVQLYSLDIDGNGSIDPVITYYIGDESVPLAFRDDMVSQVPFLKKKFNDYPSYAKADVNSILSAEQLAKSSVLSANILTTVLLENNGVTFVKKKLPEEAQFSSIYAIAITDLNNDGTKDIVLTGNDSHNRIYLGRDDANHGMVMLGDGKGNFSYLSQRLSGLHIPGDVRSIVTEGSKLLFGINNAPVKTYTFTNRK